MIKLMRLENSNLFAILNNYNENSLPVIEGIVKISTETFSYETINVHNSDWFDKLNSLIKQKQIDIFGYKEKTPTIKIEIINIIINYLNEYDKTHITVHNLKKLLKHIHNSISVKNLSETFELSFDINNLHIKSLVSDNSHILKLDTYGESISLTSYKNFTQTLEKYELDKRIIQIISTFE